MKKTFLFLAALAMSATVWAVDGTYKLCTSTDDLVAGEHYIIANGVDGDVYCMATESNANNRKKVSATVSESAIEVAEESGILTLTLGGESGAWTFYTDNYAGEDGYLASAASGKNNHCRVIADLTTATITFSEGSAAVINLQPHTERTLLRYNPSGLFACYASGQNPVYLYKKDSATPTPATLDSLVIKGKATKMEYEVGEAFDPAGLEVWGIYTKTVKHDSISQIKSGITWTLDPETFEEASDNASVTLVASYKDLTTADTTITGIKVNAPAPLPKYATIYTSNVTLSTTGGTSATEAKVVVAKGDTVDALKAGTGSAAGVLVVSIPAATKTLHFHVVGWNGKSVELDINGEALAITSDAGISNNSPFTLKGTASDYYYAIDPKGATTITFTATKDNRFVLYGVNAELEEGVVAAPAFTPTDTDFDGSVEVTLTCETEGAEIFYALNEEVTSMNAQQYTEPIKLTATTTIYAVAKKDGKESASVNKTYSLVPAYTLEELVAAGAPTADKKKVILVLENEVITGIDGTRGIYVKSGDQEIEIFCYNLPTTAVKGGTVSGRAMGDWFLYGTQEPKKWELQPADWSWATFAAPGDPTGLNNMNASKKAVKQVVNGQIVIVRDGKAYNVLGF
ncbi:MAG: chitobiase/beta-hexosaminidase C-terminal domain-containing protein [Paludibacteraceae bacterium]|nr:chitobiase/beta-hexosaminidase C-terminal domain-containing protein [Paludibacteraceae bacterium]